MKCHYEVLNISKEADETVIKSAYRKLALKWHPDKNLDNPDHAKEQFLQVQMAYEVLIDHQERAWYDTHREQILHGSDSEYKDNCLDIFQYFTSTCFKSYDDDENGFYTVYRTIFEKIAMEDMEHIEDKDFLQVPNFGLSASDYDEVVRPFYVYWTSYSTKKSYVWLDPYDIKQTRERRILKLMEKENKKVRHKAKKERNEEVRNLVAFVQKRDKRVQAYKKVLEEKILLNREKQAQRSRKKKLERRSQLNASGFEADWTKFDNVKLELEEIERHLTEEFGDDNSDYGVEVCDGRKENVTNLYCAACSKLFKTLKAFQNHELSRKHQEKVEHLKTILHIDDSEISNTSEDEDVCLNVYTEHTSNNEYSSENEATTLNKSQRKKNKKSINFENDDGLSNQNVQSGCNGISNSHFSDSDEEFKSKSTKKEKHAKTRTVKADTVLNNSKKDNVRETKEEESSSNLENTKQQKPKDKKKNLDATKKVSSTVNNCCVTCKTSFDSKNKLFQHLKQSGHSVLLPQNEKTNRKKKLLK